MAQQQSEAALQTWLVNVARRMQITVLRLKSPPNLPGTPDLLMIKSINKTTKAVFIELKTAKGKTSNTQKFRQACYFEQSNIPTIICRNKNEGIQIIRALLLEKNND